MNEGGAMSSDLAYDALPCFSHCYAAAAQVCRNRRPPGTGAVPSAGAKEVRGAGLEGINPRLKELTTAGRREESGRNFVGRQYVIHAAARIGPYSCGRP